MQSRRQGRGAVANAAPNSSSLNEATEHALIVSTSYAYHRFTCRADEKSNQTTRPRFAILLSIRVPGRRAAWTSRWPLT